MAVEAGESHHESEGAPADITGRKKSSQANKRIKIVRAFAALGLAASGTTVEYVVYGLSRGIIANIAAIPKWLGM